MVGFYGPKEDHICIAHYKSSIRVANVGYDKTVESFKLNKQGNLQ